MNKTLKALEGWRRYRRAQKPWNYDQEIKVWRYEKGKGLALPAKILCAVAGCLLGWLFILLFFSAVANAETANQERAGYHANTKGGNMRVNEAAAVVVKTIAFEASGEPFAAQVAVAEVIKTRAMQRRLTPEQAVLQPRQFSCNNPGSRQKPRTKKEIAVAQKAWMQATASGLTHYHDISVNPKWAKKMTFVKQVGRLRFYK